MEKGQNSNHPKTGSQIKVSPIREIKDIKAIKKLIEGSPLYLAIFTCGINTNLRAGDLLRIKVSQVRGLKPMGEIEIKEEKTGKNRRLTLNKACIEAIGQLLRTRPYQNDDYLFQGQRGCLTVPAVNLLVKKWCKMINLSGNYGSHTMRKTFGYHQRVTYGVSLPELMVIFNHSTQKQTLDYLCVQPDEVKSVYANEL